MTHLTCLQLDYNLFKSVNQLNQADFKFVQIKVDFKTYKFTGRVQALQSNPLTRHDYKIIIIFNSNSNI